MWKIENNHFSMKTLLDILVYQESETVALFKYKQKSKTKQQ